MVDPVEFKSGRVAVITGGASGIGFAAAEYFAKRGMHIALIDHNSSTLAQAVQDTSRITKAISFHADVSDPDAMRTIAATIEAELGPVSVLFANAGIQPGSRLFEGEETWRRILDVNFWGIVNTVNAFHAGILASDTPTRILITGSKQGITTPPGDPAYNISKAAVKTYAEALAHDVRNRPNSQIKVHLVVPGFVWTPLTYGGRNEKPSGAWTADQMIRFAMDAVMRDEFYILCPDNDVNRALDEKRIAWAAGDIIENRPPLSRWHKDYAEAFAAWLKK